MASPDIQEHIATQESTELGGNALADIATASVVEPLADKEQIAPVMEVQKLASGQGEIMTATPEHIRIDPSTGEPVIPLLFVHGVNGDKRLPWSLHTLAKIEQRQVIGVGYPGKKLKGSARLITRNDLKNADGEPVPIPEMESIRSDELAEALDQLGISQVDAVGESLGVARTTVAATTNPERFRHIVLAHPAGLGGRTYAETHLDAVSEAVARRRKALGKIAVVDITETSVDQPSLGLARTRKEQRASARTDLRELVPNLNDVTVLADVHDRIAPADRLRSVNGNNIQIVETNWGQHGIALNSDAMEDISRVLREKENEQVAA